jgi:hypothetical protein
MQACDKRSTYPVPPSASRHSSRRDRGGAVDSSMHESTSGIGIDGSDPHAVHTACPVSKPGLRAGGHQTGHAPQTAQTTCSASGYPSQMQHVTQYSTTHINHCESSAAGHVMHPITGPPDQLCRPNQNQTHVRFNRCRQTHPSLGGCVQREWMHVHLAAHTMTLGRQSPIADPLLMCRTDSVAVGTENYYVRS